jgi:hypothetical protein
MSEPAVKLDAVGEATDEIRGIASQALEWVRVSEERVAEAEGQVASAEAIAEHVNAELRERAKEAVRRLGAEGRERIAGERDKRRAAEGRAKQAEDARDRAEKAFEQSQERDRADRETIAAEMIVLKERNEQERLEVVKRHDAEAERRLAQAVREAREEADGRIAAAEQRAAEAEAEAEEARAIAVKIEAEIEERVMQGTEEVRREAEERVTKLVEKFEGEAEELARNRAQDHLQAESDRIRQQAGQREERARRAAEEEIKASASRARREAAAAAAETAPSWAPQDERPRVSGYRTF